MFYETIYDMMAQYFRQGGYLAPVLLLAGIALWTLIVLRFQLLQRFKDSSLPIEKKMRLMYPEVSETERWIPSSSSRPHGQSKTSTIYDSQTIKRTASRVGDRYTTRIRMFCLILPLLGLLGTVNGMVDIFSSTNHTTLAAFESRIGHGIAQALSTTQWGILLAVTGMIANRCLDHRAKRVVAKLQWLNTSDCGGESTIGDQRK